MKERMKEEEIDERTEAGTMDHDITRVRHGGKKERKKVAIVW